MDFQRLDIFGCGSTVCTVSWLTVVAPRLGATLCSSVCMEGADFHRPSVGFSAGGCGGGVGDCFEGTVSGRGLGSSAGERGVVLHRSDTSSEWLEEAV